MKEKRDRERRTYSYVVVILNLFIVLIFRVYVPCSACSLLVFHNAGDII